MMGAGILMAQSRDVQGIVSWSAFSLGLNREALLEPAHFWPQLPQPLQYNSLQPPHSETF